MRTRAESDKRDASVDAEPQLDKSTKRHTHWVGTASRRAYSRIKGGRSSARTIVEPANALRLEHVRDATGGDNASLSNAQMW